MAQINEIINRITTEADTSSLEKYAAELLDAAKAQQTLAGAADGATVATGKQGARLGTVAAQIDRARASLDRSYRAQQQYTREVERMTRLHTLAGSSADELAADLARIEAKYGELARSAEVAQQAMAGATAAARLTPGVPAIGGPAGANGLDGLASSAADARQQVKLTSGEMTNLGFQVNDIATQLAMGQSPFMVMASQAGQITQILGPTGSVRAAIGAFGTAMVATLTNPITLAVLGAGALATAAASYFSTAEDGAKKSNAQIDRHRKLIEDLKTAYGDAATAALGYGDVARDVLQFNAGANAASAADQLTAEGKKFLEAVQGLYAAGDADFRTTYNRNAGAIREFMASVKAGTPDVDGLRSNLIDLAQTQPALSRALDAKAASLYRFAEAAREASRSVDLSRFDPALMRREEARGQNYENLNRIYSAPMDPIGAPPAPDVKPRANPSRDLTVVPELSKESEAYRNLVAAMQQRIETAKIEQATIGMSTEAAARYRQEAEAMLNLMQQVPGASREQIEAYRSQVRALGEITQATQEMRQSQEAAKDMQQYLAGGIEQFFMGIVNGSDAAKSAFMSLLAAFAKAAILGEGPMHPTHGHIKFQESNT